MVIEQQKDNLGPVAIDLPRRTMFLRGEKFSFQGNVAFFTLVNLSYHGQEHVMPYELDALAEALGAQTEGIGYAEIYYLRNRLGDDGKLIAGDGQSYFFGTSDVVYGAYPEEGHGWQDIYDIFQIKSPLGRVKVEPTPGGIRINDRVVYLSGIEEETVWHTPNTGEHIIAPSTLSYIVYGSREMLPQLKGLIYAINNERLRPNGAEIASVRRGNRYPAVGYYLRDLRTERDGYKRELYPVLPARLNGEWQLEGVDKYVLRAYVNFARWCFAPIPHWPTLLNDAISPERRRELDLESKPGYLAFTPESLTKTVCFVYESLSQDTKMDLWPENVRKAWASMQTLIDERKSIRKKTLEDIIGAIAKKAWKDYQITLRHKNGH